MMKEEYAEDSFFKNQIRIQIKYLAIELKTKSAKKIKAIVLDGIIREKS